MNADLKAAAEAGDLKLLYKQIEKDPHVLENIGKIPFVDTPLHVATAAGHVKFATEIVRLMPSFADKLNQQGLSPLHLAIQNEHMVMMYPCLSINKNLVRLKGREGLTPLHFAAGSGNVAILAELLSACPDSIEDFTVEGETALHIAVRKGHFGALRVFVEWLQKYRSSQSRSRILNWRNESGDTVLHVSARNNVDPQTVQLLIENGMNLNVKNSEGSTALNIVETPQFANADIRNRLLSAEAKRGTQVTDHLSRPSLEERLKWMSQDLRAAAVAGDIKMLYTLIEMDPYVLDNVDKIPFVHTPSHIAAAAGHIRFATEIIRLKPSLAHKLNEQGLSPLHLAVHVQNVEMVRRFLSINEELVRVKGRKGINEELVRVKGRKGLTPLHFAAKSGQVDILAELLFDCPESIEDFTVKGETALHIAVRKGQFEALRVLVKWLQRFCSYGLRSRILNWKNESGDNVLHVSARMNDAQAVKLLTENGMNLDEKNSEGSTALDIVEMPRLANTDIKNKLLDAGAKRGTNVSDAPSLAKRIMSKFTISDRLEMGMIGATRVDDSTRSAALVVVVLIATMTYQSALSPPGGLYPPDASANSTDDPSSHLNSTISKLSFMGNSRLGTSVMFLSDFESFLLLNTLTLLASLVEIYFLLPTQSLVGHLPLQLALSFFSMCYLYALYIISPNHALSKFSRSLSFFLPLGLQVLLPLLKLRAKISLQRKIAKWNIVMNAFERGKKRG